MACGYGINVKSSELQAATLDKGHVADLMEEADKHRRLLGMKKQGSLQDTLPQQPCEEELDQGLPTRPAGWKPPEGQAFGLMELQRGNWLAALMLLERSVRIEPRLQPVLNWALVSGAWVLWDGCSML
ncbi:uncharacterized protein HaLaN_09946 [Haematococcus lacustris]|uniref:Uncharacterized protein n=1 Tax=Haematococcus lacustris TaxID=44745 RepID=A0A699YXL1_HAELA|nr:uncharacterized protein HaLaN_09946 [Haematococcus lacustris]